MHVVPHFRTYRKIHEKIPRNFPRLIKTYSLVFIEAVCYQGCNNSIESDRGIGPKISWKLRTLQLFLNRWKMKKKKAALYRLGRFRLITKEVFHPGIISIWKAGHDSLHTTTSVGVLSALAWVKNVKVIEWISRGLIARFWLIWAVLAPSLFSKK